MRKVIRTPDFPVVETACGKLHGFQDDNVFQFYGIRYGTAERFELPKPVAAWDGIKDAKAYGKICPLLPEDPMPEDSPMAAPANSFEMPHVYWPMGEDCLFLNVWTKHLEQDAKRPVMVWLHGGGYCSGSSIEIPAYDGHNLADYGDVVVVNLNHRLNCLGFLDLSSYGEEFKYSGIAGMADIVLALTWVRDNIAAFGGDPEHVTVAGQSGGGGKVASLLQMPAADGLFHQGICQSGVYSAGTETTVADEKKKWQSLGRKTVECLGLTDGTVREIRTVPYARLAAAAVEAGKRLGLPGGMLLLRPSPVEGYYAGTFDCAGFREEAKDIPLLMGTNLGEFTFMHYLGDKDRYSGEEKRELLRQEFGDGADAVAEEFRKVYPGKDILYAMSVDTMFRDELNAYVYARLAFGSAPIYNYLAGVVVPYLGGLALWHCGEIPFVFRNVEMEPLECCGYEYAERLTDAVSNAWLAFMRNGSPSTDALGWPSYRKDAPVRMVFDAESGAKEEDDFKLLELVRNNRKSF